MIGAVAYCHNFGKGKGNSYHPKYGTIVIECNRSFADEIMLREFGLNDAENQWHGDTILYNIYEYKTLEEAVKEHSGSYENAKFILKKEVLELFEKYNYK